MHKNHSRKKFSGNPICTNAIRVLGTNQGWFQKEEAKGYLNMHQQKDVTNVKYV